MKDKMNINQVERLTGVLKRNIRFFEKEGLFLPKRNRENGYCVYGETEIWRIKTWLGIMEMKRKAISILLICYVVLSLCACGKRDDEQVWNIESYEGREDIISVEKLDLEGVIPDGVEVSTYEVRYQCDECEVVSYLSVPNECIEKQEAYPCIIYNGGGNREYGANTPEYIAYLAYSFEKITFATQYRGVDGGTGTEEFGGADLNDVLKLVDICEEFAFVDMEHLYMMGVSRGGMMTYMACREDDRIKKAVVISGMSDAFMSYEERTDMQTVFNELVKVTPKDDPAAYEKRSATYWPDEINCPLLIIHSKQDEKVSYEQAEKIAQALEDAGKEYKFVTYEDDVHGAHPEDLQIIMEWCQ